MRIWLAGLSGVMSCEVISLENDPANHHTGKISLFPLHQRQVPGQQRYVCVFVFTCLCGESLYVCVFVLVIFVNALLYFCLSACVIFVASECSECAHEYDSMCLRMFPLGRCVNRSR